MCSAVSSPCKVLINPRVGGTSLSPVPVSAAWRSTCCHTARRGSTSATSAPKLLTGSPTWYAIKCRMTAGSTTNVKTVPRYSEFVGCLVLLVLLEAQEHGSGDARGWDAWGLRASAVLQLVAQGFTLLLYKYVIFATPFHLEMAAESELRADAGCWASPSSELDALWGRVGCKRSLRGKKTPGECAADGSPGCAPAVGTGHFRTLLQY